MGNLYIGNTSASKLPIGSDLDRTNLGINVYLGDAYVTTLFATTMEEMREIAKKYMGSYPDMLIEENIMFYLVAWMGGGSPTKRIIRATGEVVEDSGEWVTSWDIARRVVENTNCLNGRYKTSQPAASRGGDSSAFYVNRTNLNTGEVTKFKCSGWGYTEKV